MALSGCNNSAGNVIVTSDPSQKIDYAMGKMDKGRDLTSVQLMEQTVRSCQESNSKPCLAKAYAAYGKLFQTPEFTAAYKERNGGAGGKTGPQLSIEYLEKAKALYNELGQTDSISELYYIEMVQRANQRDFVGACNILEKSRLLHQETGQSFVPNGFGSYDDFYNNETRQMRCNCTCN